ncbi:MAG: N-acetylglucosamine-6-phosphate deacetylase [Thermomicrobiales bacterium]
MANRSEPDRYAGRDIATGVAVELQIAGGEIVSVEPWETAGDYPWIAPGLVDLQVNGYMGFDLNDGAVTAETVRGLAVSLLRTGVTTFLPTIVTASPEAIGSAMCAIVSAIASDPLTASMIAGIHLEGPFISPEDGARGAHPAAHVRSPDWGLFEHWQELAGGRIRMVTLSPEWPEALEFIARCRATGVIPAIGHTAATPAQIQAAVASGAMLSTHLGNGAHAMLPRHPNYLWEQLAADGLWATAIADGFHLPDSFLKVLIGMKGDRAILVSDSVALAGMPPGEYANPIGGRVVLTPEGRLHLADDPRLLAGSALPLIAGVAHLAESGLTSLARAWTMGSTAPRALLGFPQAGGLAAGEPADIVLFQKTDHAITIENVIKGGQRLEAGTTGYLRGTAC